MLTFILNNETVQTSLPPGTTVLDFVRYHRHLMGTKIGCREGDCGACTVIVGEWIKNHIRYRTMTSCLMPLQHAAGKHIITIEGINPKDGSLTPVQQAMVEENGTQCGFCTVGFVMSLSWVGMHHGQPTIEQAIASVDGNICRCTGYKSIERAAERICNALSADDDRSLLERSIAAGFIPEYMAGIPDRLNAIQHQLKADSPGDGKLVAGGTDLYVQQPEALAHTGIVNVFDQSSLRHISEDEHVISIGGAVTVTDLVESEILLAHFPRFSEQIKLVSSTPIRNMATVAGNLVNASPIGDLTIWLLALNATVVLKNGTRREVPLRDFYQGYKVIDKTADEIVEHVYFKIPSTDTYFNFEKVSKRQHLDIATVNTALSMIIRDGIISHAHLSAGGVGPTPLFLKNTSPCLNQHRFPLEEEALEELQHLIQSEIHPIDDVRGSSAYKRLLMQQLFIAHLIEIGKAYAKH